MKKRHRPRVVQMNLLQPRPCLPAWSSLPETCRTEAGALLVQIFEQHMRADVSDAAKGVDDE